MGGGKEKNKTNQMLNEQYGRNLENQKRYEGAISSGLEGAQGRASDMYGVQFGGYGDFAGGKYDFDPSKYGSASSGGGGGGGGGGGDPRFGDVEGSYRNFMGGGGVDTGAFNRFQGNLQEIGASGGWSPERIASMDENIRGYKDIARTGGVDAEGQARMRGSGVFDEFAKTGGYSDLDRANIRSRATSGIPSMYGRMRDEAARASAVQGGYGPGRTAMAARMGRDQASAIADASLNAELGIMDKVNAGRQWGGSNIASSEGALQQLLSSNRLAGLGGASSTEANMLNSIAQNRIGASSAGGGNEIGMQGLIQKGKMFGTQGLEGMAESAAARSAAGAAQAAADAKWRAEFDRSGRQYGLEGMSSLYGAHPGEVEMYLNAANQTRATGADIAYGATSGRMQNNPQRDWLGTIGGLVGAGAGLMTGMGAMGFGAGQGGNAYGTTRGRRVGG